MSNLMGNEMSDLKGRKKIKRQDRESISVREEEKFNNNRRFIKENDSTTIPLVSMDKSYGSLYQSHDFLSPGQKQNEPISQPLTDEKRRENDLNNIYRGKLKLNHHPNNFKDMGERLCKTSTLNLDTLSPNGIEIFDGSNNPLNSDMKTIGGFKNFRKNGGTNQLKKMNSESVVEEELTINPKNVFCSEASTKKIGGIKKSVLVPAVQKNKRKKSQTTKKSSTRKIFNEQLTTRIKLENMHENKKEIKRPITDNFFYRDRLNRVVYRKPVNLIEFHKMSNHYIYKPPPLVARRSPPPFSLSLSPVYNGFNNRVSQVVLHNYHHIVPNNVSLQQAYDRRNLKFSQDPSFFRIPQPSNNCLIMQDTLRVISRQPLPIKMCKNTTTKTTPVREELSRMIIRLKINGQLLYEHDYINVRGNSMPSLSQYNITESSFIGHLNSFNEKYGIPKLSVKYAGVMNFMYNEIRKKKGYFNVKPCDWKVISQTVKNFVRVKELYLFLVYPFEQFLMGKTNVIRYKSPNISYKSQKETKIFTTKEINSYLKKGTPEDLDKLFCLIDVKKLTLDGFYVIARLLFDIYIINLKNSDDVNKDQFVDRFSEMANINSILEKKNIQASKRRYKIVPGIEDQQKTISKSDSVYIKNIRNLRYTSSVKYVKNCINIGIAFGKSLQKNFKILDLDQNFLNNLYLATLDCKERGILTWDEFYCFTNTCYKNFYPGTDVVYIDLYKNTVKETLHVLRTLSNVRFSKTKTKRMFRRLSKFIYSAMNEIVGRLNAKSILNDDKVLEYIISSFFILRGFRMRIRDIVLSILEYYVYRFNHKLYQRGKNDSDLFKIITRLMLFEDIKDYVYTHRELIEKAKRIPGLGELL